MIVAQPSRTFARTALGCALFLAVIVFSLTRETQAQPSPAAGESRVAAPGPRVMSADKLPPLRFPFDASVDGLDTLFVNGVVSAVGGKIVTVEEVRREIKPLVALLQRDSRDQADFNARLNRLQNQVVGDLIQRAMLIKQFHRPSDGGQEKRIAAEAVDREVADRLQRQFDGDRAKLDAYLQQRGVTLEQFRGEIEEEIIYHYMKNQERNLDKQAGVERTKTGPQVHLRMIELKRAADETDAALQARANAILARFRNGETFAALAQELSEDKRRTKGGDWGWMTADELQKNYSEMAFALKAGEVSAPIILPEGCFLLFVEERK